MTAHRRTKPEAAALRRTTGELAALSEMTPQELAAKYREVFGQEPQSYSRERLLRHIAYRLQEQQQGGLSQGAKQRIEELASSVPPAWKERMAQASVYGHKPSPPTAKPAPSPQVARPRGDRRASVAPPLAVSPARATRTRERDPRLPAPGAVLTRDFDGRAHRVLVGEDSFEYAERRFRSLSAVARFITGTPWNGFYFFQESLEDVTGRTEARTR